MIGKRIAVIAVAACLTVGTACDRSGLSRPLRKSANRTMELINQAEASGSEADLDAADQGLAETKTKTQNPQDVHLTDVMDWYLIVLHRHNHERTAVWRQLCAEEVRLYLSGEPSGRIQVNATPVLVKRGACQAAAFEMMAEDCRLMGKPSSSCSLP